MSLKNKAMALGLSAAMLLSPAASLAESNYAAGELTTTAISDSYAAGNQLNLSADFNLELGDALQNLGDAKLQKKVNAVVSLLDKTELNMSFYDDFGTARIHLSLDTDGVTLLSGDALVYADGSMQIMTTLTGKLVLALPQGALSASSVSASVCSSSPTCVSSALTSSSSLAFCSSVDCIMLVLPLSWSMTCWFERWFAKNDHRIRMKATVNSTAM